MEKLRFFGVRLMEVQSPRDVLDDPDFRDEVISSCFISRKSAAKLGGEPLERIVREALEELLAVDNDWKETLLLRAALTYGDALGGSMRNIVGRKAEAAILLGLQRSMADNNIECERVTDKNGKVKQLKWNGRLLVLNRSVPLVGNNVDVVLLDDNAGGGNVRDPKSLLVCGEVKGGIDPAGADEHWKTARSALQRIRDVFQTQGLRPKLFFAGAAIESSMAREIYGMLGSGELDFAANLSVDEHAAALFDWLVTS